MSIFNASAKHKGHGSLIRTLGGSVVPLNDNVFDIHGGCFGFCCIQMDNLPAFPTPASVCVFISFLDLAWQSAHCPSSHFKSDPVLAGMRPKETPLPLGASKKTHPAHSGLQHRQLVFQEHRPRQAPFSGRPPRPVPPSLICSSPRHSKMQLVTRFGGADVQLSVSLSGRYRSGSMPTPICSKTRPPPPPPTSLT